MKKQYIKGYNIEFHRASLINKSHIVLSNELPYGNGRLEAIIRVVDGQISAIITDGYEYLTIEKSGYKSLKTALNIMHGKMQEITYMPEYKFELQMSQYEGEELFKKE